jgi:hypothetical protein
MKTKNKLNFKNKHLKDSLDFSLILIIFIFIVLFLYSSSNVFAFGIAPAKTSINFEPGFEREINFLILSKGEEDKYLTLQLEGNLSNYAQLNKNNLHIAYGDTSKDFGIKLKLPSELPQGKQIIYVKVIEQDSLSGATASVANALIAQIIINVPYDGVYVEGKLDVQKGEVNKPILFTISLFGRGKTPANCYGVIEVKGPTNELVKSLVTNKILVSQGTALKVEAIWNGTTNEGIYTAQATLHCEDKMQTLKDAFYVGSPSIEILSIYSDKFILGEISPIDALLKSNWNSKFDNVYLEFFVLDNSNNVIQTFKSSSTSINAKDIATLRSYWETKGLIAGNYLVNLVAYIDDMGTNQKSYKAEVSANNLKIMALTGDVVSNSNNDGEDDAIVEESFFSKQLSVLTFLVIVLLFVNVYFFNKLRKKNTDDVMKLKKK